MNSQRQNRHVYTFPAMNFELFSYKLDFDNLTCACKYSASEKDCIQSWGWELKKLFWVPWWDTTGVQPFFRHPVCWCILLFCWNYTAMWRLFYVIFIFCYFSILIFYSGFCTWNLFYFSVKIVHGIIIIYANL